MQKSLHRKEYKTLLRLLYQLRIKAGMKQTDLAKKLDVHQSFVSKLEIGERRVDIVELKDICEALDGNFKDFLNQYAEELHKR